MSHQTTKRFWKLYWNLPPKTRDLSDKAFDLLKDNPSHPSLQFKKVGKLYSTRVDIAYRALAVKDGSNYIWVWIGTHDEYEKLIN
jgi:hypothetical protein